ncbi:MAG: DUF2459 domain-containing protein [Flavobacteriaceae bacterium]|nr:DUF2459 domain-containing protein [Flavobacteriaceae bacterium]
MKYIIKGIVLLIVIPIIYIILSLIFTYIPIKSTVQNEYKNELIYLHTNGVHLSIIIEKKLLDPKLLNGLNYEQHNRYFSFAWGDKNFYLNTPTWSDLTFKNAFIALFLKSPTLIHVTRYDNLNKDWIEIRTNKNQLIKLNTYLYNSFYLDGTHKKTIKVNSCYSTLDDFYEAKGNYSCFNTCNSWVNTAFKKSDLNACLWTPFDFGLYRMYQTQ